MNRLSFLWPALILTLSSCTGRSVVEHTVPPPTPAEETTTATDSRDLSCAYFYFLWGSHAEFDNRLEDALEAYEKALVCDPEADYISQKLPLLYLKMGDSEQARQLLEQAIAESPHDNARRFLLATILIQQHQYPEAIQQFRTILSYEPDNDQALLRLGIMLSQTKQFTEAQSILSRLLDLGQEIYLAHLYLARIAVEQGDNEAAEQQYQQALKDNWSTDLVYEAADFYLDSQQYQKAIDILRTALDEDETDERARLGVVQALLALNRENDAIAELRFAQQFSTSPERISLVLSRLYMRLKQQDKAINNLQALIKSSNSSEARYLLAVIYAGQQRFSEALSLLDDIDPGRDGYEDVIFLKTKIQHETGHTEEALQGLESFLKGRQTDKPMLILMAASLNRELGNGEKSLALLADAAERYPEDEQVLFDYGLQLEQSRQLDKAIDVMERIIAISPDHAEALNFVGYCWADSGKKLHKALEYISRAMELRPGNGYIQDSLGWVYFRLGDYPRAERELLAAHRLIPEDPNILEHLGDLYTQLGKPDSARDHYQTALDNFTDEEAKQRVRQKLERLTRR